MVWSIRLQRVESHVDIYSRSAKLLTGVRRVPQKTHAYYALDASMPLTMKATKSSLAFRLEILVVATVAMMKPGYGRSTATYTLLLPCQDLSLQERQKKAPLSQTNS